MSKCVGCENRNVRPESAKTKSDGTLTVNYKCGECGAAFASHDHPGERWLIEVDGNGIGLNGWSPMEEFDDEAAARGYYEAFEPAPGVRVRLVHVVEMKAKAGKFSC